MTALLCCDLFALLAERFRRSKCLLLELGVFRAEATTEAASSRVIFPEIVSPCEASRRKDWSASSVVNPVSINPI